MEEEMDVIGMSIRSRATGSSGIITGISKDKLSVSFQYSGSVDLPLAKYDQLLEVSPEVREGVEEFKASLKKARKTKAQPQEEEIVREI
jgi:hypothetical protein